MEAVTGESGQVWVVRANACTGRRWLEWAENPDTPWITRENINENTEYDQKYGGNMPTYSYSTSAGSIAYSPTFTYDPIVINAVSSGDEVRTRADNRIAIYSSDPFYSNTWSASSVTLHAPEVSGYAIDLGPSWIDQAGSYIHKDEPDDEVTDEEFERVLEGM